MSDLPIMTALGFTILGVGLAVLMSAAVLVFVAVVGTALGWAIDSVRSRFEED